MIRIVFLLLLLAGRTIVAAPTQAADSPPDAQPGPTTAPVPLLSAEQAAQTMHLPAGFHMEVVAAEPMVEHPVALSFDADGRMWVVEMPSYMPDLEGHNELNPTGKILILEDTDGDGRADRRTVFMDKLMLPHAVTPTRDGALVDVAPNLLFCRDTNGDGRADEQTIVARDFGGPTINPENWPNGLVYNLDNWFYCAAYDRRIHYENGKWSTDSVPYVGQFGIARDNFGRLFHNTNSDYLRGSPVPLQYAGRNPNFHSMDGINEQIAHDQTVWPSHGTAVNRGYLPNFLREDGTLRHFTGACGPVIYRGGVFGSEFDGNAFACDVTCNVIRRAIITEVDGMLAADNAYENREFVASTYERFRPVNLFNGPDGALYVVDMHHGLIQHTTHLTTYARNQYLQRDLHKYLGTTGRIYRIVPDNARLFDRPQLSKATSLELVGVLSHANGWWRDTAQRLLVERNDYRVAPALKKLATSGTNKLARLHALWTLSGMRQLDPATLIQALADTEPKNRAAAIRLCEPRLSTAASSQLLPAVMKLADDPQPDVRLQFALTISALGLPQTDRAAASILQRSSNPPYVQDAVISGLRGRELEFLTTLLQEDDTPVDADADPSTLKALAECVVAERLPRRVAALLELAARQGPEVHWRRDAILAAFPARSTQSAARRQKGIMLDAEPPAIARLRIDDPSDLKRPLANVLAMVHWPGQKGYQPPPPPRPLSSEELSRFENGRAVYAATCLQCHKSTGLGQEGLAPPLLDSEWALGPESRVIRIVLHGLNGPITVAGRTHMLDMPALGSLKDADIAAVLTFVRRSWDHEADPVDPSTVAHIRALESQRTTPWTERELLNIR